VAIVFYFTASGIRNSDGDHFECGGEVWGDGAGDFRHWRWLAMEAETVIIYNGFLKMWVYQNFDWRISEIPAAKYLKSNRPQL
jgi:hypothetical protein